MFEPLFWSHSGSGAMASTPTQHEHGFTLIHQFVPLWFLRSGFSKISPKHVHNQRSTLNPHCGLALSPENIYQQT